MWVGLRTIAKHLGVSKETIYRMLKEDKIPASKIGGQWRFNRDYVDLWLLERQNIPRIEKIDPNKTNRNK